MAEKKIAAPTIPDSFISQQATRGEELRDKQSKPRFSGTEPFSQPQNMLLHALLGLQAGTKAATQTSQLQSPLVGLLAGLGAGASVPGEVDAMRLQAMDANPFETVAPGIAQKYNLAGVPTSYAMKLIPFIQRGEAQDKSLTLAMLKESWRDDNQTIGAEEAQRTADAYGDPTLAQKLLGLRRAAAVNILPRLMYDPSTGSVQAMAPKTISVTPPGAATAGKEIQGLLNSYSTIRQLNRDYSGIAEMGKTGIVSGNLERFKGAVSGGKFAIDATAYASFRNGFVASLKSMTGENGVLSDPDTARIISLLPSVGEDAQVAAKKFKQIFDLLDERTENYKAANPLYAKRMDLGIQKLNQRQDAAAPAGGDSKSAPPGSIFNVNGLRYRKRQDGKFERVP